MPPLTDPERLAAYKDALGNWSFAKYIHFELTKQSDDWIRLKLGPVPYRELGRLMNEYVKEGGTIDEQPETRDRWRGEYDFHYDLRFSIEGVPVYFETRLIFESPFEPDEPWILVVNVHGPDGYL